MTGLDSVMRSVVARAILTVKTVVTSWLAFGIDIVTACELP